MTMRRIALSIVLSVMLAMPTNAAERNKVDEMIDILLLWNDCRPLDLVVERLNDDAAKIKLGADGIKTTVRQRLRAAQIYDESRLTSGAHLYAQISVNGNAVFIGLKFNRQVRVPLPMVPVYIPEVPIHATTWDTGWVGTHGGNSKFVLALIGAFTDKFIDEYLRVNRGACEKR